MILVTGAGGFIGSHLVDALLEAGETVRAFVHYNSHGEIWDCPDGVEVIRGDIRDYDNVRRAIKGCEQVYHLAALIGIPYSYESPLAYLKTNTEGTYNVLEAAREERCRVLIMSTSEVYGSAQFTPMDESHPIVPQSPYAASKVAADALAVSYVRSFGSDVVIARPFNTYGPRQSQRAIIPTIITQLMYSDTVKIGNGDAMRDFTYVGDAAKGLIATMEHGERGETYNLCSGKSISIRDLIRLIKPIATIIEDNDRMRPKDSEVNKLEGDNTKARKWLRWEPEMDLDDGLLETARYWRANVNKAINGCYHV